MGGGRTEKQALAGWIRRLKDAMRQGRLDLQFEALKEISPHFNWQTKKQFQALVPRDFVKSLRAGAKKGDAETQFMLGYCYQWGIGVSMADRWSFHWWRLAAEQRHVEAMAELGFWLVQNSEENSELEVEGVRWELLAAKAGHVEAIKSCSKSYAYGLGVRKNRRRAFELMKRAAELGDAEGVNNLGVMYHEGTGTRRNDRKAVECYRRVLGMGDEEIIAVSCYNLGLCYQEGDGVPRDPRKARVFLRRAHRLGHWGAARYLGELYFDGEGVRRDYRTAFRWFEEANDICKLGICYRKGLGVRQDPEKAVRCFEEKARWDADSARQLGLCHLEGDGVPRDRRLARRWLDRAVKLGSEEAKADLEALRAFSR